MARTSRRVKPATHGTIGICASWHAGAEARS